MSVRIEKIGNATLYLGDCREIMPTLGKVDAVITDPPYDARTHGGAISDANGNTIDFAPLEDVAAFVSACLAVCNGWCIAFCPLEELAAYKQAAWPVKAWVRAGIWDRIVNTPQFTGDRPAQGGEGVAVFHRYARKQWNGGGRAAIWRHTVERGEKRHPTQKPLRLIRELVHLFSDVDDTVLDPFMGSGTTGVAAIKEGRRFIGIEIDPDYFEIAVQRVSEAQKQGDLFVDTRESGAASRQSSFLPPNDDAAVQK